MPEQHALLSPSSAKRWMTCGPSARLEAEHRTGDESSVYAAEGTLAHAIAETLLHIYRDGSAIMVVDDGDRLLADVKPDLYRDFEMQAQALGIDFREMVETVHEGYARVVYESFLEVRGHFADARLLIEEPLRLGAFIPEGFGTSDAIIIGGPLLQVYDLKYGKGVKVDAQRNPQMMCYALGAMIGPAELSPIKVVDMTIIQPRLSHASSWTIEADALMLWAQETLRPAALRAWAGQGELVPGDHCRFCKVAARCKALAHESLNVEQDSALMTDEELSQMLSKLPVIRSWADQLEAFALDRAMKTGLPGWKVVEGRSVRKITNQEGAMEALAKAGLDVQNYLKPRELKTISELERSLRKQAFGDIIGPFVTKGQGKPTLAPESDPRPAFSSIDNDFNNINV